MEVEHTGSTFQVRKYSSFDELKEKLEAQKDVRNVSIESVSMANGEYTVIFHVDTHTWTQDF